MSLRFVAPAVWGTIAAVFASALADLEPSLLEEGMIVHVAQRLLDGDVLYRDVVFFTGPLPFELLAALFRLLGEEIAIARGVVVLLQGLSVATIFTLARSARSGVMAHAIAASFAIAPAFLFPLLSLYFYTTLALHLSILAVFATTRGSRSLAWAAGAGILVACVALCKQNLGLVLAVALFLALVTSTVRGRRMAGATAMTAGGASVAVITLFVFALRGTLPDFVHSLAVLPFELSGSFPLRFPSLWPPGSFDVETSSNMQMYVPNVYFLLSKGMPSLNTAITLTTQALFCAPFLAVAAGLVTTMRRGWTPPRASLLACLIAWMTNLHPRPDWGHLTFVLPLAISQLLLVAARPSRARESSPRGQRLAAGALTLFLLAAGSWAIHELRETSQPAKLGPHVPQRPVASVYRSPALPLVVDFLQRNAEKGEAIFIPRQEPLLYFATGTRNPTPFEGVIPGLAGQQEAILAALPSIRFLVMSDLDQAGYTFYAEELPEVQAEFERYYSVPSSFPIAGSTWIFVAERGEDRGKLAIDLVDQQRDAQRWTRDRERGESVLHEKFPRIAGGQLHRPLILKMDRLGGGIDFEVELPQGARFVAGAGMRRIATEYGYAEHTARVDLRLAVGRNGTFETVHAERVRIGRDGSWRWRPVDVDLSAFAGQRVTLRLEAVPISPHDGGYAWWGSPRITVAGRP